MNLKLIVIGKTSKSYLEEGMNDYFKRINRYLSFEYEIVPGVKLGKKISAKDLKKKEAEAVLKRIRPSDYLVLTDEKGKAMNSLAFAEFLNKKLSESRKQLVFLIGGAHGFSDKLIKRADYKISFSEMTFSHQLFRLIFAEQLYRAFSIIKNEPYHNG